jgi:hypothetical protein
MINEKKIKFKQKLKHTHEKLDDIYEQYFDGQNNYTEQSECILFIISQLSIEEQNIFYLYAEYNSLRMVADECNISYVKVKMIIDKIKKMVKELDINDFYKNYINK